MLVPENIFQVYCFLSCGILEEDPQQYCPLKLYPFKSICSFTRWKLWWVGFCPWDFLSITSSHSTKITKSTRFPFSWGLISWAVATSFSVPALSETLISLHQPQIPHFSFFYSIHCSSDYKLRTVSRSHDIILVSFCLDSSFSKQMRPLKFLGHGQNAARVFARIRHILLLANGPLVTFFLKPHEQDLYFRHFLFEILSSQISPEWFIEFCLQRVGSLLDWSSKLFHTHSKKFQRSKNLMFRFITATAPLFCTESLPFHFLFSTQLFFF